MKALSLTQPWASLVALGSKRLETRAWYTSYRGPLAIHATKAFPGWCQDLAETEAFQHGLDGRSPSSLPRGCILCIVNLRACVKANEIDKLSVIGMRPAVNEITFGNFYTSRWAWALELVEVLDPPVPAVGFQRIWDWTQESKTLAVAING
jgi:hypothetical protein